MKKKKKQQELLNFKKLKEKGEEEGKIFTFNSMINQPLNHINTKLNSIFFHSLIIILSFKIYWLKFVFVFDFVF